MSSTTKRTRQTTAAARLLARRPRRPGPAGGVRDENRRRRQKELLEASRKLFLARGIESVTIDEIVEEAGVAKGSFYRYFPDKGAMVEAMFAPLRDRVEAAMDLCERALGEARSPESVLEAYQLLAAELGAGIVDNPLTVHLYLQESRAPAEGARAPIRALANRIDARAIELTKVAHDRGLLRPFDGRVSARAVVGAVEKLLFAILCDEKVGDIFAIPEQLISLVMDGLEPR